VGVDVVLGEEDIWLIEINPRPTTSYVGLRRLTDLNLAAAIWHACRDGSLPSVTPVTASFAFGKEGTDGL
jgi:tyramine---L-glutamate ligase